MSTPKIDWGYSVNRLMEAARRSVDKADADPCAWELGELIKAKLTASYEGRKISGVEGIRIVQEHRNEARAVIAAEIEKSLLERSDDNPAAYMILEVALKAEELRMGLASDDPFVHQLKLATMCEELTGAVLFLLCKQLTPKASANPNDPGAAQ